MTREHTEKTRLEQARELADDIAWSMMLEDRRITAAAYDRLLTTILLMESRPTVGGGDKL